MEKLSLFIRAIGAAYDICVQISNIVFDPSDRCTLPIHFVQLLLEQWPF